MTSGGQGRGTTRDNPVPTGVKVDVPPSNIEGRCPRGRTPSDHGTLSWVLDPLLLGGRYIQKVGRSSFSQGASQKLSVTHLGTSTPPRVERGTSTRKEVEDDEGTVKRTPV